MSNHSQMCVKMAKLVIISDDLQLLLAVKLHNIDYCQRKYHG